MLYLGGSDRWIEADPKERENQHGYSWTIHGVLLLEYSFEDISPHSPSPCLPGGVQSLRTKRRITA